MNAEEPKEVKMTFGIQPKMIERIEQYRTECNNSDILKGSNVDMAYSEHFWKEMGKEFGWSPFTLALHYFNYLRKKELTINK